MCINGRQKGEKGYLCVPGTSRMAKTKKSRKISPPHLVRKWGKGGGGMARVSYHKPTTFLFGLLHRGGREKGKKVDQNSPRRNNRPPLG